MLVRSRGRSLVCWGLLGLILAFIWGNSIMPGETSGAVSGWVGELLRTLLPFLPLDKPEGIHILRKIAHFSEFAALGFVLCWRFGMWVPKFWQWIVFPVGCGVAAAGIDEVIQVFSPGRYCSIVDVMIDSAGVVTGVLALVVMHWVWMRLRKGRGR